MLALGLLLPLALAAAQLVPGSEFAARSLRGSGLTLAEMRPGRPLFGWGDFRKALADRAYQFWPGSMAFAALAPLALAARATRRQAGFHALVVAVSLALAIDGPALRASLYLPLGRTFRFPDRRLWIAAFGAAMLTALGARAIARGSAGWKPGRAFLVLAGAAVLWGSAAPARRLPSCGPSPDSPCSRRCRP